MKTLTAFCDLAFCPVSFDFCVWLARAMFERDKAGCDHLHVVLMPHEHGLGGFARAWGEHDQAATRWRLWHICMACVPLAGATVTLAAGRKQAEAFVEGEIWRPEGRAHLAGPLIEAARKGAAIPKLRATGAAKRYVERWLASVKRPVVTLTTRNQATHPDRNSNATSWGAFNEWLCRCGCSPILLCDSNIALGQGRGYAELDPDLRLALYERAAMNCIGNNGPAALLWFSGAPFLQFGFGLPADKWTAHMAEHVSLEPGEQLPWARPDQRLVWRPDSFEVMRDEFERAMVSEMAPA